MFSCFSERTSCWTNCWVDAAAHVMPQWCHTKKHTLVPMWSEVNCTSKGGCSHLMSYSRLNHLAGRSRVKLYHYTSWWRVCKPDIFTSVMAVTRSLLSQGQFSAEYSQKTPTNTQQLRYFYNSLVRPTTKKTSKLHITGPPYLGSDELINASYTVLSCILLYTNALYHWLYPIPTKIPL